MALRLRKDVQKASYYVWFLGAQEAKGLRGSRVLLPVIPRLVEKSKEQEPLKVTLQISHKGLKIIQGSSKHFIPHGAITCSVQTEDIVACVLLLYNPATKCPLHVHAYRCDSETTAQALHDQLQILINRPENQKRFAELETRLGLPAQLTASVPVVTTAPVKQMSRRFESPRRFDSSLGSDTGTSTRESECSEEHSPTSPISPIGNPTKLYDSLAAELRAKLSGNGAPLLLPPRDYDTVHRSKGNLAAIELRRCRNSCIVGAVTPTTTTKHVVSSRGSSGIGSDLAPSPERHDAPSSSDEEWTNEHHEPPFSMPPNTSPRRNSNSKKKERYIEEPMMPTTKYRDNAPNYIYPRESSSSREDVKRYQRSSSREEDRSLRGSVNSREEDVKPIITKQTPLQNRFREVFNNEDYVVEDRKKKNSNEDKQFVHEDDRRRHNNMNSRYHQQMPEDDRNISYKKPQTNNRSSHHEDYDHDQDNYRENLTDKQKYREIVSEKVRYPEEPPKRILYRENSMERPRYREMSPERKPVMKPKYVNRFDDDRDYRDNYREPPRIPEKGRRFVRDESPDGRSADFIERNPYKENDSLPYRESIENMMKSPVMRYKSFDDSQYGREPVDKYEDRWAREVKYPQPREKKIEPIPKERYREDMAPRYREEIVRSSPVSRRIESRQKTLEVKPPSPESTMKKVSPKDRFQTAKEKFQNMERDRERYRDRGSNPSQQSKRSNEGPRRGSLEPASITVLDTSGWSSDEELPPRIIPPRGGGYRELPPQERYPGLDKEQPTRMIPAKSLGSLVKGYRHSYAEPRNQLPRSSGRVGLAAVNPY